MIPWTLKAQLGLSNTSILGHLFEFHKSHNSCFLWIASPTWNLANSLYWGGCDCLISIANGRICSTCKCIIFRSYQYFLERRKKITTPPPLSFLETENFLVSNTCQIQTEQCLYVCTHMSSVFRLWRSWLQLWKSRTHCTLTGSLSVELAVLLQVTCPQVPATSSKQKVLLPLPPLSGNH